jgi:hypothetical protein
VWNRIAERLEFVAVIALALGHGVVFALFFLQ